MSRLVEDFLRTIYVAKGKGLGLSHRGKGGDTKYVLEQSRTLRLVAHVQAFWG